MRAVVQRVLSASVTVDGQVVGQVENGLLVYVGVTHTDTDADIEWLARKVWDVRILRDERSASDADAPILVVSQFTLYGDARKGRRPTWQAAAPRETASRRTRSSARSSNASAPRCDAACSAPT